MSTYCKLFQMTATMTAIVCVLLPGANVRTAALACVSPKVGCYTLGVEDANYLLHCKALCVLVQEKKKKTMNAVIHSFIQCT